MREAQCATDHLRVQALNFLGTRAFWLAGKLREAYRSPPMNIQIAIAKAGSISALARILGVSRQAVQQMQVNGLTQARVDQLRELRPEWFAGPSTQSEGRKHELQAG